MGEMLKLGL